jgi:uncharacterized membrane protein HdeD (DUF308 family)
MTATLVIADGDSLRHKWGWFLGLGIVLILLGTIALVIMPAATLATVLVLGWLMAFSGVFEERSMPFRSADGVGCCFISWPGFWESYWVC